MTTTTTRLLGALFLTASACQERTPQATPAVVDASVDTARRVEPVPGLALKNDASATPASR